VQRRWPALLRKKVVGACIIGLAKLVH
jgi:hypothetical protein